MSNFPRRDSPFLAAVFAILLSVTLGVLAWQLSIYPTSAEGNGSREQETARPMGQVEEETHTFRSRDDRLVDIGVLVPGFGGMYIDPANPDVLNVFMLDTSEEEQFAAVEVAIRTEFPDAIPPGGIAIVKGDYPIGQLKVWYDDIRFAISAAGLIGNGLTGMDLEEDKNRLEVAVESEELVSQIEALADEAGIPAGVVRITIRGPYRFLHH